MAQHQCHQSLLTSREQRGRDRERSAPCIPPPPTQPQLPSPFLRLHLYLTPKSCTHYSSILTCMLTPFSNMSASFTRVGQISWGARDYVSRHVLLSHHNLSRLFGLPIIPSLSPVFPPPFSVSPREWRTPTTINHGEGTVHSAHSRHCADKVVREGRRGNVEITSSCSWRKGGTHWVHCTVKEWACSSPG